MNADWVTFLIVVGIFIGWMMTNLLNRTALMVRTYLAPGRPMRVVRTRFDTVTPAVTVEPPHRFGMWITYTHAYILRGELCQRRPLNVREMASLTGLSSRQQGKYLDVLKQGRVIAVVPSGGVRWLVGKRDRRRLLPRLPYPHDVDPPAFQARSDRDGCNSA